MAKLIDAEKWLTDVRKVAESIEYPKDYVHMVAVERLVENAPSVDAIPVDWIKEEMKFAEEECLRAMDNTFELWLALKYRVFLGMLLTRWEKLNE